MVAETGSGGVDAPSCAAGQEPALGFPVDLAPGPSTFSSRAVAWASLIQTEELKDSKPALQLLS